MSKKVKKYLALSVYVIVLAVAISMIMALLALGSDTPYWTAVLECLTFLLLGGSVIAGAVFFIWGAAVLGQFILERFE